MRLGNFEGMTILIFATVYEAPGDGKYLFTELLQTKNGKNLVGSFQEEGCIIYYELIHFKMLTDDRLRTTCTTTNVGR